MSISMAGCVQPEIFIVSAQGFGRRPGNCASVAVRGLELQGLVEGAGGDVAEKAQASCPGNAQQKRTHMVGAKYEKDCCSESKSQTSKFKTHVKIQKPRATLKGPARMFSACVPQAKHVDLPT